MYLSKGKEWNGIKLSNLDQMFQNKGMEMNENEWNVNNLILGATWKEWNGIVL